MLFALAVLTVFTGCADEEPIEIVWQEVPAAKNFKAEALLGANYLTWDIVPEAESYKIFRRKNDEQMTFLVAIASRDTVNENNYGYLDAVSLDNPLEDKAEYTYQIYSIASAKKSGIAETKAPAANIPAKGTPLPAFTADEFKAYTQQDTVEDVLYLYIEVPVPASKVFSKSMNFYYAINGSEEYGEMKFTKKGEPVPSKTSRIIRYDMSTIYPIDGIPGAPVDISSGGTLKIQVTKTWINTDDNAGYYNNSEPFETTLPLKSE